METGTDTTPISTLISGDTGTRGQYFKIYIGHFQSIKTDVWLNFLKTTATIKIV